MKKMLENNQKIAGQILTNYGIHIKSTDEIIPFYGLLFDLNEKIKDLQKQNNKTEIHFTDTKIAFWYGIGKWLGFAVLFSSIIIVGFFVLKPQKNSLPINFINNSILVTKQLSSDKKVTGFLLQKGEKDNYKPGQHYLLNKSDGTILVPLE